MKLLIRVSDLKRCRHSLYMSSSQNEARGKAGTNPSSQLDHSSTFSSNLIETLEEAVSEPRKISFADDHGEPLVEVTSESYFSTYVLKAHGFIMVLSRMSLSRDFFMHRVVVAAAVAITTVPTLQRRRITTK